MYDKPLEILGLNEASGYLVNQSLYLLGKKGDVYMCL